MRLSQTGERKHEGVTGSEMKLEILAGKMLMMRLKRSDFFNMCQFLLNICQGRYSGGESQLKL
jgi:hypothetical protein